MFDSPLVLAYNQQSFSNRRGNFKPVKNQRPINLNLFTIKQPIPAIVSILHRISGVVLFLFIPILLWALSASLASPQSFDELQQVLTEPTARFIFWCFLAAFIYHFVAGIRHLLMDIHVGEELKSGRVTAILTMLISFILIALAGVWLW